MRQDVDETLMVSYVESLRRVSREGDLQAWAAFQQSLERTVLTWLHEHPDSQAACCLQSEKHLVSLAFERLQQAVVQRQVPSEILSVVLVYLRASLNGAILEALRVFSHPGVASNSWSVGQDCLESSAIWDRLQALLSNERERRLAYLLYHCELEPPEIVRCCPNEWSDIHEVTRLRNVILKRLMNKPNR